MNREQFFQELRTALHREGFTPQPEQDELLPVEWDGLPLCRITADGGVRYWQEDVATPERERACERATDLACTVREYMTLLEQAPPLQAQSLTGDYRLLADFNGAVLAAHPTRLGVQFVTWDWSFDRTGLNQGNYFQENYVGAKQDFAIRAGLISKQQIFNQEQLIEIYRCCSDTLDAGFDLTAKQEKCIRGVQEQIAIAAPDALERIREQEQHPMEPYNQEPIMYYSSAGVSEIRLRRFFIVSRLDQKNEQIVPLRIKNLAELKRCIRPGTELVATSHSKHPTLVGLVRVVTEVQTNAYYSVVKDQPTHQYSTCNYGKGFRSDFEKASNYLFEGTTIKVLDRRSGDGSVLYEMELYPGECLVLGQKNDMEENADIREDNSEIKQEGMNMTL